MSKFIDSVVKPAAVFLTLVSFYSGVQYGAYKLAEHKLHKEQDEKGLVLAVKDAQETLEYTPGIIGWVFSPGYRLSLVDYVENNRNLLSKKQDLPSKKN